MWVNLIYQRPRPLFCGVLTALSLVLAGLGTRRAFWLNEVVGPEALLALPLQTVTPLLLLLTLLYLPARVGLGTQRMKIAVILHLTLILAFPSFALLLVLGTPVVFLLLEIYERVLPSRLRVTLDKWVLA